MTHTTNTDHAEALRTAVQLLMKSEKFRNWNKLPDKLRPKGPALSASDEHFAPQQLALAWGVDLETIRNIFREEPGVLKINNASKRRVTLRIPREVAERVHRRLAA